MSENSLINGELMPAFSEVRKETGELVTLMPNTNNTVQPVALMRLGLFVPTLKSTTRSKRNLMSSMDATEELKQLTLARSEGYNNIKITGERLDMDNDFKTWVGIIHSFAKHKVIGDKVTLKFVDFAKLCGIPSTRSSKRLRERLDESLRRIVSTTLSFTSDTKAYHTHLVQSAFYDTEADTVTIKADPEIFELYQFDHKVLLQLRAITELARKESAQALYTFIESLPSNPAPVSMARLRARLNLKSRVNTQNATVRRAMDQLREIGYLDFTEIKKGKVVYFMIHERAPKLNKTKPVKTVKKVKTTKGSEKQGDTVLAELTREELEFIEKIRKSKY
ncbi:RepB family plasmid replication initiator protein [Xenorhabdus bovienii]|uniref:RepB family plasmid replication initiator protein n=1 Tax=Xenorhabdus bovienii TaxID=40576 RepID=UPI0023B3209C|nr:RepB family plasmid replication initiator protein [Xenorhabdus bovienii]MDE9454631.1 RepB family plasmid replication initiator protein [Xenorhabdus bovienii]MDE9494379.1 RepB family plasmid replication initiator protein [Xenorhabdus bovienii]MDE9502818.1 RepB family plasmid replication initiator protein [Xenorhabdus bovienii]MDE9526433.1 RepB family plasmid replication initiator protein [Xenorhabdus bovienii]MDE9568776.1 RepB family plasmid replication initiator protein [Xenorhabdus bovieni